MVEAVTRRALFSLVAAALMDPDRLLWVPGRKRIFIPRNQLITPAMLSQECLKVLKRNLAFARSVNRRYRAEFQQASVGDTVYIRKPRRFVGHAI